MNASGRRCCGLDHASGIQLARAGPTLYRARRVTELQLSSEWGQRQPRISESGGGDHTRQGFQHSSCTHTPRSGGGERSARSPLTRVQVTASFCNCFFYLNPELAALSQFHTYVLRAYDPKETSKILHRICTMKKKTMRGL